MTIKDRLRTVVTKEIVCGALTEGMWQGVRSKAKEGSEQG